MPKYLRTKKSIGIIMVIILLLNVFVSNTFVGNVIASGNDPTITVGTVSGKPGNLVEVPVSIKDNPGIVAFYINISYDASKLKLTGVTNGTVLTDPSHSGSLAANPYRLCFDMGLSPANNTSNGVVATLLFEIPASAEPGDTEITCSYNPNEIYNIDYNNVPFYIINGKIEIQEPGIPTVTVGENAGTPGSTGIEIPVTIENNPGIVAFYVNIGYDSSKIKLTGVTNGTVLTDPAHSGSITTNPYRLCFDMGLSPTNNTSNGVVATLMFEIPETAEPGDAVINITYDPNEIYDVKMNNVFFEKINGKITVIETLTAPTITAQPTDQTVSVGQNATFTVVATGAPAPAYQWQADSGSGWTNITGATGASCTVTGTTFAQSGTRYRCVATNSQGSVNSGAATLTVNKLNQAAFSVNSPGTKTYGNTAFQLSATGGSAGAVTYTYVSGPGSVTSGGMVTITGAGSIVVKAARAGDAVYNPITSANLTITVNKASLTLTADNKSIVVGGSQPAYTYGISGLVSPDTAAVITTQPTISVAGFSSATPAAFPITLTGGATSNANYTIGSRVNGTLTVSAKTDVSGSIVFTPGSATYTGTGLDCAAASGLTGGTWTYTYTAMTGMLGADNKPLTAGTYSVTAKFEDAARTGTSAPKTFTVNPRSIGGATVTISGIYTYTGSLITPAAGNVYVALSGYTPTYTYAVTSGGTSVGTATVTVTGTGNFIGTATGTFTVLKADGEPFYASFFDDEVKIWADGGVIPDDAIFKVVKIMPPPPEVTEKVNDQVSETAVIIAYYEITLEKNGNLITKLSGEITIATKLPPGYESGNGVSVYQQDASGTLVKMNTWVEDGYIFYKTNWLETYDD